MFLSTTIIKSDIKYKKNVYIRSLLASPWSVPLESKNINEVLSLSELITFIKIPVVTCSAPFYAFVIIVSVYFRKVAIKLAVVLFPFLALPIKDITFILSV